MTAISVQEPDAVKLRRTMQDRAVPAFASATELQAWLEEISTTPTTLAEVRASLAVIKDKIIALTVSAALAERQQ